MEVGQSQQKSAWPVEEICAKALRLERNSRLSADSDRGDAGRVAGTYLRVQRICDSIPQHGRHVANRRSCICLAIDSKTLCTAPWRHHRVQRSRRLDGGGAASRQSDVDNRQQSLPNQRVIGLPGDTVACKGSGEPITVNGKPIDESAYLKSGVNPSDSPFSVTVTDGNVFVLGDNRSNSRDSRYHLDDGNNGLVPYDDIQGVALFRFWPFTRIGILN